MSIEKTTDDNKEVEKQNTLTAKEEAEWRL